MTLEAPDLMTKLEPIRVIASLDAELTDHCRRVVQHAQPVWSDLGRRSHARIPFPELVELKPLTDDGRAYADQPPTSVVGKNLAPLGFDFYHQQPIAHRFVVACLPCGESPTGEPRCTCFVLKITWCRFLRPGWYDSGGRFVKVIEDLNENSLTDPDFSTLLPNSLN